MNKSEKGHKKSGEDPLISIITPSFNQGAYIEETILSVISQDYNNVEYIIIDGGSSDESVDIIRKYENRVSYWHSCPDKGQAHAINQGFKMANGDILAWLNADDLYLPGTLKLIAKEFKNFPETDFIYGDCVFVDEKGNFIRYFTECEEYDPNRLLNYGNYIMQPTTFFSKKKLTEVGFLDESLVYTMDWDLWCCFAKKKAQTKYLSRVLAANRVYSGTKTYSGGIERIREVWRLQKRHITGFWPHAFWGIAATELFQIGLRSDNRFKGQLMKLLGRILSVFSPQAIHYLWRNKIREKVKYGLYPYSGRCRDNARILLPFYGDKNSTAIDIEIGLDAASEIKNGQTHVTVSLEGVRCSEFFLSPGYPKRVERVLLSVVPNIKNKITLDITFKKNDGISTSGHVHRVCFVHIN